MDQRLPRHGDGEESICTSSPSSFKYNSTRTAIPEDAWKTSVQTLLCPGSQMVSALAPVRAVSELMLVDKILMTKKKKKKEKEKKKKKKDKKENKKEKEKKKKKKEKKKEEKKKEKKKEEKKKEKIVQSVIIKLDVAVISVSAVGYADWSRWPRMAGDWRRGSRRYVWLLLVSGERQGRRRERREREREERETEKRVTECNQDSKRETLYMHKGGWNLKRIKDSEGTTYDVEHGKNPLSPILYTLFTHDCVATHPGNIILKFADDTAVIGRITGGDEAAYRKEVDSLVAWCTKNNLTLNADKTKEMIVDMRKERRPHQPLFIRDLEVERVSSFKYLGVHISDDLTWTLNTTYVLKRAQQRLYFLRRLRKFGMSPRILSNFYSCIIESILTSCITVWYGSTTVKDRKRLQRVVKTATKITKMAREDPSLQSIYNLRVPQESCHPSSKIPPSPPTWTILHFYLQVGEPHAHAVPTPRKTHVNVAHLHSAAHFDWQVYVQATSACQYLETVMSMAAGLQGDERIAQREDWGCNGLGCIQDNGRSENPIATGGEEVGCDCVTTPVTLLRLCEVIESRGCVASIPLLARLAWMCWMYVRQSSNAQSLRVLWPVSYRQRCVGNFLWAASYRQCPVGSILWAASYGQQPMDNILWEASCGQRPVSSILWVASCGQHPMGSVLWATSCGQLPMGSNLWTTSYGKRPVGNVL
ncbi:hypothetical protein NFI96_023343 [Prochilodus magdalenae]|nr:hypothetical protein NFI96_023343 [Prochilodus magdalenae]